MRPAVTLQIIPLRDLKWLGRAGLASETSFMKMLISFSSRTWHLPTLPKLRKVPDNKTKPSCNLLLRGHPSDADLDGLRR
ncbi:hypothetical protein CHARACLAT_008498 [Characodon lateralis]|uniref:Uncharacterized protein n=1 Tax=Characodon lateralis TaxID=208331 RepID=A0ABU7EJ61_9TELE|nr:hypothetical protein [Characodon lateralis]